VPRSYPRELEADVALRDGSVVHIRPVRAEDEARLLAFLQALPDEDRLMRLFGLGNNLARTAHKEASVDYATSMGLVAAMGTSGEIVGHAMYVATGDDTAEVAFAIARAYQGIGMGTLMLGHLAQAASVHGIGTLKAVVLAENRRMIDVLRGSGFPTSVRYESNMIEVTFPAALKPATLAQFEHREELAAANALPSDAVSEVGCRHRRGRGPGLSGIGGDAQPAGFALSWSNLRRQPGRGQHRTVVDLSQCGGDTRCGRFGHRCRVRAEHR